MHLKPNLAHSKHYVDVRCYFICRVAVQILTILGMIFINATYKWSADSVMKQRVIVFIRYRAHTHTNLRYPQVFFWCVLVFTYLCVCVCVCHSCIFCLIHFLHCSSISPTETS